MSYSPLASSSTGEFLIAEDRPVSRVVASEWNKTRIVHVAIIIVCVVCTTGAILFAIAENGASSLKHHVRSTEVSVTSSTLPPDDYDLRNLSLPAKTKAVETTPDYAEAKAAALEDSGLPSLDALPSQLPAYEHVASLMNENKSALVVFLGVATGGFVVFGIFFSIALYQKHVRQIRAINLENISRELDADVLEVESGDEEDLFVRDTLHSDT